MPLYQHLRNPFRPSADSSRYPLLNQGIKLPTSNHESRQPLLPDVQITSFSKEQSLDRAEPQGGPGSDQKPVVYNFSYPGLKRPDHLRFERAP